MGFAGSWPPGFYHQFPALHDAAQAQGRGKALCPLSRYDEPPVFVTGIGDFQGYLPVIRYGYPGLARFTAAVFLTIPGMYQSPLQGYPQVRILYGDFHIPPKEKTRGGK
jgi:hypothetical protein